VKLGVEGALGIGTQALSEVRSRRLLPTSANCPKQNVLCTSITSSTLAYDLVCRPSPLDFHEHLFDSVVHSKFGSGKIRNRISAPPAIIHGGNDEVSSDLAAAHCAKQQLGPETRKS